MISTWEVLPGHEAEAGRVLPMVHGILRRQSGVVLVEAFESDGRYVTVHGYRSETAYRAVLDDPGCEFNQSLIDYRVERMARWLHSERGETLPHV